MNALNAHHDATNAKAWRSAGLLTCVGLALRLPWVLAIPVEPIADSEAYLIYAQNLINHGVYGLAPDEPGAYWPVGTSAITAVTFLVFGESFFGVVLTNMIASALIMLMAFALGQRWFGTTTGLLACGLVAVWPNLIYFTSILSSELYFIALVMAGLWFWERRESVLSIALCGLIWGLACYLRPVALLLPIAMAFAAIPFGVGAVVRRAVQATATMAIMLAVLLPWTLRNMEVLGEPVLVSTNFGPNLWMGNNPDSTGGYMELPSWIDGMSETERARALGDAAKDHILSDPAGFVLNTLVKAVKLYSRETIGVAWNQNAIERLGGERGLLVAKLIATGFWYALMLLSAVGLWHLAKAGVWRALFHPATLGVLYFTALHSVIVVEDRYHMPVSGFIAILAGLGVASLLGDRRIGWGASRGTPQ